MSILGNYVNVTEAAQILGVHGKTGKRLCGAGKIPAEQIHNIWLIAKNDLSQFTTTYDDLRREKGGGMPNPLLSITPAFALVLHQTNIR